MVTKKSGSILLNLQTKQIGLVYRETDNSYTFPKGHLEENETLEECAVRETEEETLRQNHLLLNLPIHIVKYITPNGEDVENYMYISVDDGPTLKDIPLYDREIFEWVDFEHLDSKLLYDNLKSFWNKVKEPIYKLLENNAQLEPSILTDLSICPTCYDNENDNCLYGDISERILFENSSFKCFLVGNPRSIGHTIISTTKHYKDMLEIPDDLCKEIFIFSKKVMNVIKQVYKCESVYICSMSDGPMNHFHIQLIPRYDFEKRGSKNFVKTRMEYVEDKPKIEIIRKFLNGSE